MNGRLTLATKPMLAASLGERWRRALLRSRPVRALAKASERQRLGRLIVLGLLWAVICTVIEAPNLHDGFTSLPTIVRQMLSDFVVIGLCLAIAVFFATAGRGGWLRVAVAVVVASAVSSAMTGWFLSSLWTPVSHSPTLFGANKSDAERIAIFTFLFWLSLVYGGIAAILYELRRRIDRMAIALHAATLARERNEAAIAEAKVREMVERIEPRFLLDVMQSAREHYRTDPTRGEDIVNGCVAFLRSAMPQVRSRRSNLSAELDLARAYLDLRSLVADEAPTWRVEASDDTIATGSGIPLAPLVLLPLLERLVDAQQAGHIGRPLIVRDWRVHDFAFIDIEVVADHGVAAPIEAECLAAIDERLRISSGPDARITAERFPMSRLVYRLQCPMSAVDPSPSPRSVS